MKTLCYYIENNIFAMDTINELIDCVPCFVRWDKVEMNYLKVTIQAREEDVNTVENFFATLV